MSRFQSVILTAVLIAASPMVWAGEPKSSQKKGGACTAGCGKTSCYGDCGALGGRCRKCKHHIIYEGQDPWANCGCNGSYNYPVPPLYTYHWRGLPKQRLMTDYHSPWRFPAIKPFQDEDTADVQLMQKQETSPRIIRATHTAKPPQVKKPTVTKPVVHKPVTKVRRVSATNSLGSFFK